MLLGALGLALAGAPAAQGERERPFELRGSGGGPLHGPYKRWADAAHVPLPEGRVRVGVRGCPGRPEFIGCVKVKHPRVIFLRSDNRHKRSVFLHELGHVFDLTTMRPRDRRAFKRVHGRPGRRWWRSPNATGEWFAEAYSLCARYGPRFPAGASATYSYRPGPRRHRRSCAVIRRAAAEPTPRRKPPESAPVPPILTEPVQDPTPIAPPPPEKPPNRECILVPILCPVTS